MYIIFKIPITNTLYLRTKSSATTINEVLIMLLALQL